MENKTICPRCKNKGIKKDGKRYTQNRGFVQRYKCKKCSFRFVKEDGFYRMRNNAQKITLCLDLFFRGISTRKVQEHLKVFYPHNADHSTILRWIVKYSKLISNFTDKLKVKVG
jgi:transposase-like protein